MVDNKSPKTTSKTITCKKCSGTGLIRCTPIKCSTCNGNPRGCYKCKAGYIQYSWKTCTKCYGSGSIKIA